MEKRMSIKNIVFDLGRVLIKFEPKEYTEKNVPEEKREAFYNGIFGSDEWQMLDRGTLSYEDAKKIFKERVSGVDKEIDRLFDADLFEILQPIEENVKLLPELKKKYNLYEFLARNNISEYYPHSLFQEIFHSQSLSMTVLFDKVVLTSMLY